MVRELRLRHHDRFSDYFSPEALKSFNEEISGRFSGIGLTVTEVKQGLRVESVFPHSPAARAGLASGDVIISVDGDSIAGVSSEVSTEKIKGPEGTEVTIGVKPAGSGKVRELEVERAQIALPVVTSKVTKVNGRHARLRAPGLLQRRSPRARPRSRRKGREEGGRRDRARPARQRRRPARGGGAYRQRLPAQGRSRRHHRLAHPGPRRLQDGRRQPAKGAGGRPDRPQHRLGGGDPHRGAGRRRRRQGGRHPLLRQGCLPAGGRPLQRRGAEADDRRVLHPGRGQPGQEPRHPPRGARARPAANGPRRGRWTGPSAFCQPNNELPVRLLHPVRA